MVNMKERVIARILQAPAILLIVISFLASAYLAFKKEMNVTPMTPVILGVFLALYFWGRVLEARAEAYKAAHHAHH